LEPSGTHIAWGDATYGSCPVGKPDRNPILSSRGRMMRPALARETVATAPPDSGRGALRTGNRAETPSGNGWVQ